MKGEIILFRIGEFSKMSKTTIKTLRYYDEEGLLKPEKTDKFTNYRFYTTGQLVKLHKIQQYRQLGLSISEIKLILSGENMTAILQKRKAELIDDIANGKQQLSRIEFILSGKEDEYLMNYQAVLKDLPECIVYYKTLTVPSYNDYFKIVPAIGEEVKKENPDIKCTVPGYCFIVYLDGEYKEKDFNIEFCESVDRFGKEFDDIKFKKIQSVKAVSVMHKGSYSNLPKAYAFAYKWIDENGFIATDNPRESYIDGIWNKQSEEDWLTELQIPVAKK